jgi:hypothetical protein
MPTDPASPDVTVGLWEYPRDDAGALRDAARVALDRLFPPDLEGVLVPARADNVTVQVVRGEIESAQSILYVQNRGMQEILRVERWPGPSTLLVLKAWLARDG